jgi:ISXO2-like transposase domain
MFSIDINREPETERSPIFLSIETAIEYLLRTNRLASVIACSECSEEMSIVMCKNRLNGKAYLCKSRSCRKTVSIFKSLRISSPKVEIFTYLLAIYKWIENVFEKDVLRNLQISKSSYQGIKQHIYAFIKREISSANSGLLGDKLMVQVDETVICHGSLLDTPSNLDDDAPGVTWLVGIIEQGSRDIRLEIVPNRKAKTMSALFERHIAPGTVVVTDGYRSYPSAVAHIQGRHIMVNHSDGFKNIDGFHTNNVENLWSLLKYEIKRRRGILKSNISVFLNEFWLRYTRIRLRTNQEVFDMWNEIVSYLFENE